MKSKYRGESRFQGKTSLTIISSVEQNSDFFQFEISQVAAISPLPVQFRREKLVELSMVFNKSIRGAVYLIDYALNQLQSVRAARVGDGIH